MSKKEPVIFNKALHGERLEHCIKEFSDHKAIIEGAQEAQRELKKVATDELGVDAKEFTTLLNLYHKGTRNEFEAQTTEVLDKYDAIFSK